MAAAPLAADPGLIGPHPRALIVPTGQEMLLLAQRLHPLRFHSATLLFRSLLAIYGD